MQYEFMFKISNIIAHDPLKTQFLKICLMNGIENHERKEHASTKIFKVDIPKDQKGLSFGCNGAKGEW